MKRLNFELACLKKKKKKKENYSRHLKTFWFSIFAMLFMPLGVLLNVNGTSI